MVSRVPGCLLVVNVDTLDEGHGTGGGEVRLPSPINFPPLYSTDQALDAVPDPVAAETLEEDLVVRLAWAKPQVEMARSTEACCLCDHVGCHDDHACFDNV